MVNERARGLFDWKSMVYRKRKPTATKTKKRVGVTIVCICYNDCLKSIVFEREKKVKIKQGLVELMSQRCNKLEFNLVSVR